jgi:hypothetical protein
MLLFYYDPPAFCHFFPYGLIGLVLNFKIKQLKVFNQRENNRTQIGNVVADILI